MTSSFFTADYRDGRVIFGGKSYPAGVFATHICLISFILTILPRGLQYFGMI